MPAPFSLAPDVSDTPAPAEIAARLRATGRPFGTLAPQAWETGLGKIGSDIVQGYKDYADPFTKDASGNYVADTAAGWTPNAAGKLPAKVKDPAIEGLVLGADIGSNFIGGGAGAAAKAAAGVLGTRIVSPAIRVGGRVHFGINHAEALEGAAQTLRTTPEALLEGRGGVHRSKIDLEGFVDDKGNYLNRAEAAKIADNAGQTPWEHAKGRELVAEDLDPMAEAAASGTRAAMKTVADPMAFLKRPVPAGEKPQLRVAAQEPGGAVHVGNPGEVHAELIERHGLEKYPEHKLDDMMGWVGPDGKFMDRGAAYDWYRANVDAKSKILNGDRGGGLLTDDIPNEAFGGVSPPPRK